MEKNKFIRLYLWVSVLLVLGLVMVNFIFLSGFPTDATLYPTGFYGLLEKTMLHVTLSNMSDNIELFNWPLVLSFAFFVLTVLTLVFALTGEQLKKKRITEFMVYNTIIAFLLVVSSMVFMFLIPDTINGVIKHSILFTKMPIRSDDIATVFNFTFILVIMYVVMNIYVLSSTSEQKVVEDEDFNEGQLLL